ncbi:hypothetical protein GCM10011316_33110 [Roseibium aquae]|uniref:SOUL heme-binding protein n=1 Tax=Roseibium aquae TaxID=1323746 RepID=A0A916X216_9HYPH|nr:hypothetical protein GCM10011316_33110 [Roseibium aquae]
MTAAMAVFSQLVFSQGAFGLDQPSYTVLSAQEDIEIRRYDDMAAVEVSVRGSRSAATREAFGILFAYISGANTAGGDIAMTAPVRQEASSEKISMTAPVIQTPGQGDVWRVAFYLPRTYSAATAPRPTDPRVQLITVEGKKVAAIQFSGRWTDRNFRRHQSRLEEYIDQQGLTATGQPVFAYFNAPFTLPPFRRNEVQIPLAD